MSNWVAVRLFLAVVVGVAGKYGRTKECYCGYGGLCLVNETTGIVEFPCTEQLCTNVSGGYYNNCDDIINHCDNVTCKHGGECVKTWGSYFCRCPQHYFGQTCDIYNPAYTALSISDEVYVYNQIQPDRDGVHMFHIIYNLRNEWEDRKYDIGGYRYKGSYVSVNVTVSDGREFFPRKKEDFRLLDVKSKCQNEAEGNRELYDGRICDFLPEGEVWTYSLETTLYRGFVNRKTAQSIELMNIGTIGVAGTLQLKIEVVGEVSSVRQVLFDHSYRIFSYTDFRIPHNCPVEMVLYGCSRSPWLPIRYSRGEVIRIGVSASAYCSGALTIDEKWTLYRNIWRLGGHVSQRVTKFDFSSSESIVFNRFIQIPERFFEPGKHMVIYERIYRGEPPHYGSPREFSTFGRCWLNVTVKRPWFIVVGGDERTVSCISNPFHFDINLGATTLLHKGVPTTLTWPRDFEIEEFEFTRACNYSRDPDCVSTVLSGNTFIKHIVPCDENYSYRIEARHRSGFMRNVTFGILMRFRKTDSDFIVYCWFNCFPIDPNFLTILVINRYPYLAHKFSWTVSLKNQSLIPPGSNFSIFENSTATGIMRVHVLPLNFTHNKKKLAQHFVFTAERGTNFPAGASLTAKMIDFFKYAELFELLPLNYSDHLFKYAPRHHDEVPNDLELVSAPIQFRVLSRSRNYPKGDVVEVYTTSWTELSFRPFFSLVRLCMRDSNYIVACTAETELRENETRVRHVDQNRLDLWFHSGNNNFLLSGIVIYLSNSFRNGTLDMQIWRQILSFIKKMRSARPTDISAALVVVENYFNLMIKEETRKVQCENVTFIRDILQVACDALKVVDHLAGLAKDIDRRGYLQNFPFKPSRTPSGDLVKMFVQAVIKIYSADINSIYFVSERCNVNALLSVSLSAWLYAEMRYWVSYYYRTIHILNVLRLLLYETTSFDFVRSEGTSNARVYTVSSTYFGVRESFKKPKRQNEGVEYILRPPSGNGSEWLRYMDVTLPDISVNQTALFQVVVLALKKDITTVNNMTPFLVLYLTQEEKNVGFIPFSPEKPYNCTMPIKPDSGLRVPRIVAESIVQPPFPRDRNTPWRCLLVFRVKTNQFNAEHLWMEVVQFGYIPPWKLKGIVSFIIPDHDDFSKAKSLPGNLRSTPTALGKSRMEVVPPEQSEFIPSVFYIGFLLDETVNPGVYWIGLYKKVPVCMVRAIADISRQNDIYCTTLQNVNGTIQCKCHELGVIYGKYDTLKITRLLIEPISLIWRVSRAAELTDTAVVLGILLGVLLIYAVASIRDSRRKRQEILIPVIDVDPSVKDATSHNIILGVKTGKNPFAGTISNVAIKIFGTLASSKVHILKTLRGGSFRWHGDDWFVIPEKEPLGEITHVSVWIDYRLCSEWYCSRMWMMDTDTHRSYLFEVDRWFKLHPTNDESRMVQLIPALKKSEGKSEDEFHRSKQTFVDYYATELHNTHLPSSIIALPVRSVGSYKARSLMYIFKIGSMFLVASVIQRSVLQELLFPEFYRRTEYVTVISSSSLVMALCIATFSHVITYPAHVVNQLYVRSAMIQKRVTRNLMRSDHHHSKDRHYTHSEGSVSVQFAFGSTDSKTRRSTDSKTRRSTGSKTRRSTQQAKISSFRTLYGIRSKSLSSPSEDVHDLHKHSKSPNKRDTLPERNRPETSPSLHSADKEKSLSEPRQTDSNKSFRKGGTKRMSFEHEQAKPPLMSYFIGPSQFWVVNISRRDASVRIWRYSLKASIFIGVNLLLLLGYHAYFAFGTVDGSNFRTIASYTGLAVILDAIVLEPLFIFLKALLAFSVFKMSNSEYHLWYEEDHQFHHGGDHGGNPSAVPSIQKYSSLSYPGYLRRVTGKPYKPLTSAQLDEKRKQQKLEWLLVLTVFYICLQLAGFCFYKQLSWENIAVEGVYLEGLAEAFNYPGMNDVVNITTLQSYIINNYMFENDWYQWRNHRNISRGGTSTVEGEEQPEATEEILFHGHRALSQYEGETWESYKDGVLITTPIWLGGKLRQYMKVFNGTVTGRSGENYAYEGHAWTVSLTPFTEYYTTARILMDAISASDFPFALHVLIFSNNYMTPYMPGISYVDVVIEQVPSGLYSATMHIGYHQAGDFSDGKSLYPSLTYRRITSFLAVAFFGFNIYFLSKFGFTRYFGDFRWIFKSVFLITIFANTYYSAYHFPARFHNSMTLIENHFMGLPVESLQEIQLDASSYDRITSGVVFLLLLLHAALFMLWYLKLEAFKWSLVSCAQVALIFALLQIMSLHLYVMYYQHAEARKIFLAALNWSEIHKSFDRTLMESTASLKTFRAFFAVIVLILLTKICTAVIICKFQLAARQLTSVKEETGWDETKAAFQFIRSRCSDMMRRTRKNMPNVPPSANSPLHSSRPSPGPSTRPSPGPSTRPSPGPSTRPSPGRRSVSSKSTEPERTGWLFRSLLGNKFNFIVEKE